MATETKRGAEKRLGQRPMRGPSCWWSLGKPQLSLLDKSSGLWMDRQPCRRAYRFSSIQVPGLPMLLTCLSLDFPICSMGGAPQLSQLMEDNEHGGCRGKGDNQPSDQHELT